MVQSHPERVLLCFYMERKSSFLVLVSLLSLTFMSLLPLRAGAQWREPRREIVFGEVGLGVSGHREGAFTHSLRERGYHEGMLGFSVVPLVSLGVMLPSALAHTDFGLVFRYEHLEHRMFERIRDGEQEQYAWDSKAVALGLRVRRRVAREWLALYAQAHAGLGYATSEVGRPLRERVTQHHGFSLGAVAGLAVNFFKYGGMFCEAGFTYAPILENGSGARHNDGGTSVLLGFRVRAVTRDGRSGR